MGKSESNRRTREKSNELMLGVEAEVMWVRNTVPIEAISKCEQTAAPA